jgi:glycosyltransferase involved in cell wall biosynthesis
VRVVRIYHSAVVAAFRARDHRLRDRGVDLCLIAPTRWNEGGRDVHLDIAAHERSWLCPARTVGRHPYVFAYDPRPIFRALRRRPDLIDVHEEPASLAALEVLVLRALLGVRAPLTMYSAQNIYKRYPPPFHWIERWAFRAAKAIYCCNTEAAEVLAAKGYRGAMPVIGLGIDTARFAPAQHTAARPFTVGYVGRLESHKGVAVLIDALTQVPSAELRVVGAGPDRTRLEERAGALGSRVRFVDFVDHASLPGLYRTFDVVAIPSLPTPRWKEQFGRVAVEAMASGVPVVASADGSLPEVVGPGGILVPPGDPDALADAINQLLEHPELRDNYARAGREWVSRYSWEAVADRHYRVYEAATL